MVDKPLRRADCVNGPRPCPWVSCRHHLGLRVTAAGELRITFPDDEGGVDIDGMAETCALDVADSGPQDVVIIAALLGIEEGRVVAVLEKVARKVRPRLLHLREDI